MRKILLLAVVLLSAAQVWAASIDESSALSKAQNFLAGQMQSGKIKAPVQGNLKLAHVEWNSREKSVPVYYVFNADNAFVIVSGEDRSQEILAYGHHSLDVNGMPENMKYWLSFYKRQLEFLQASPFLQVSKQSPLRASRSVLPLLTAEWDQKEPYWNECPVFAGSPCCTGCPATSLAMVFYYWKYPKQQTPAVPSYTMPTYDMTLPTLPPTVFDWDNMLDRYADVDYNEDQASAVAHLMRYIGQSEEMDYTISGSGAFLNDIYRAVNLFEYDPGVQMVFKSDELGYDNYSDAQWESLIQNELLAGRPIVYCAYDNYTGGGHAFNVDGVDENNLYSINWGWSGRGNGYFALNAFSYAGYTFGTAQQMLIGIQPPADYQNPRLQAYPTLLEMQSYISRTATATLSLKGTNLTDGVTLTLNDAAGVFSLSKTTLSQSEAESGIEIIVTYAPNAVGNHEATVVCTSEGTDPVTVTLHGSAPLEVYPPVMLPADESRVSLTSFTAQWTDETPSQNVASYTLEVQPKPAFSLIAEADFSALPQMAPSNQASHAADYLPEGWTFSGSEFNLEGGCVSIRRNGTITTGELDLKGYDKMTVEITAKAYGYYGDGSELYVTTSRGAQELVFMYAYETKTIVVDCNETEQIVFKAGYYPMIKDIKIYAGDATQGATLRAVETGDATWRLIEDITMGKRYTVSGLTAGGSFLYRVKALYTDGCESDWSNVEMVTLFDNGHDYQLGDVNHDGFLTVADVTMLINGVLSGDDICPICADLNSDNSINIADVTMLINKVLSGM